MIKTFSIVILVITTLIYSCSNSNNHSNDKNLETIDSIDSATKLNQKIKPEQKIKLDTFIDSRDSKKYPLIKLGKQVWMATNLYTFKFRNGEEIPQAKSIKEWIKAGENKKPAWCYYENNEKYGEKYGILYNWYAISDEREIAPKGFHIPYDKEWEELRLLLGKDSAGSKMKTTFGCEMKKDGFRYEGDGSNSSLFSGLPSGTRGWSGKFFNLGYSGYWWTKTEDNESNAWYRAVRCSYPRLNHYSYSKLYGMSVRCLRDN